MPVIPGIREAEAGLLRVEISLGYIGRPNPPPNQTNKWKIDKGRP